MEHPHEFLGENIDTARNTLSSQGYIFLGTRSSSSLYKEEIKYLYKKKILMMSFYYILQIEFQKDTITMVEKGYCSGFRKTVIFFAAPELSDSTSYNASELESYYSRRK